MQVKSEFKIHTRVVYLDKNVQNVMGNKYLLSLGYDDQLDANGKVETALVFKIWDFISLDSKYNFFTFSNHTINIYFILFRLYKRPRIRIDRGVSVEKG